MPLSFTGAPKFTPPVGLPATPSLIQPVPSSATKPPAGGGGIVARPLRGSGLDSSCGCIVQVQLREGARAVTQVPVKKMMLQWILQDLLKLSGARERREWDGSSLELLRVAELQPPAAGSGASQNPHSAAVLTFRFDSSACDAPLRLRSAALAVSAKSPFHLEAASAQSYEALRTSKLGGDSAAGSAGTAGAGRDSSSSGGVPRVLPEESAPVGRPWKP